jgi:Zn-dependent alcohol dehydrogenase
VITEWANLDELPAAYDRMKAGETVKVMVTFP